ncbi:hypothetical protein QUB10_08010 [Microcoleus sp. B5-D4]|uniref:hypothetical protein n=1 Tax=Microcoleus sp. B5-D4 TaxID=2818681 RepID=UPI002FD1F6B8
MLFFKKWQQQLAKKLHRENRLIKVSRTLTNKVFQNFDGDEESLLPGFYYYAGLQIQLEFFSSYSLFLGGNLELWRWNVYDGFGQGMLNDGVGDTKDEAAALAQTWAVDFLEGREFYMSNHRKNPNESIRI